MKKLLLVFLLVLVGCRSAEQLPYESTFQDIALTSCANNTDYGAPAGSGILVRLYAPSGERVGGAVELRSALGSTGTSAPLEDAFICLQQDWPSDMLVSVYPNSSYEPLVFKTSVPRGQAATIDVHLKASCTTQNSCFANIQAAANMGGGFLLVDPQNYTEQQQDAAYSMIEQATALAPSEYELTCLECRIGRGGYVQGSGTVDGKEFTFYYRHGWCSSGGSDCGYDVCASGAVAKAAQQNTCEKVRTVSTSDTMSCTGLTDTSNETRAQCSAGAFTNGSTFSLRQISNRCVASVVPGRTSCI